MSSKISEGFDQAANITQQIARVLHPFESLANFALATCATTTVITSLPVIKIGAGRALKILLRSKLFGKPIVTSQRTTDVESIRNDIFANDKRGHFLVVQGPKGIGKTTAIETALKYTAGVIYVPNILSYQSVNEIQDRVMTAITNIRFSIGSKREATKRVLFFYKIFTWFGLQQPIIVLQAIGRNVGDPLSQLDLAARSLSDMGLKVVIDCSDGAVGHKEGVREARYHMEPMPENLFQKIYPEPLYEYLQKSGTYDVVMAMCCGIPARLDSFEIKWNKAKDDNARLKAVDDYVCNEILLAIEFLGQIRTKPNVKEILAGCLGVPHIKFHAQRIIDRLNDVDFHKVFRVTTKVENKEKKYLIIPSTPAMGMVLRDGLDAAGLKQAQHLISSWKKLEELFGFLRKIDDYQLLVEICRGKRDAWPRLEKRWREVEGDEAKKTAVRMFVRDEIATAIQEKNRLVNKFPQIKDSIELFKGDINSSFPIKNLEPVSPAAVRSLLVVRVVDGKEVYVPRSPTMAIVLAAGLRDGAQLSFDCDGSKPENSLAFEDVKLILDSWTERDISIVD